MSTDSPLHIVGGDFNDVLDPDIDRSGGSTGEVRTTMLAELANTLGLQDIWCRHHPMDRAYSYFSGAHRVFSRLDNFFTPASELSTVTDIDYLARGLSDHSPLWLMVGHRALNE